jgi:ABC-2 type transport system ATP-binding protein
MSSFVHVQNLGKYFGTIKAVDDVSFSVKQGEVLGFLGPNGAGKSTTMKMISCFLTPDFGTVTVRGYSILKNPTQVRANLGYLPENAPAYEDMTVVSFLNFIADVRGLSKSVYKNRLDKIISDVHLEGVLHQTIGTLSKGFKRRVGLAQAILHDPEVLILDEPTDGLDPNQKFEIRKLIKSMAPGKAIVLSTHILEEVDELCTRVIIISAGKIVANETPASLHAQGRLQDVFRSLTKNKEAVSA